MVLVNMVWKTCCLYSNQQLFINTQPCGIHSHCLSGAEVRTMGRQEGEMDWQLCWIQTQEYLLILFCL